MSSVLKMAVNFVIIHHCCILSRKISKPIAKAASPQTNAICITHQTNQKSALFRYISVTGKYFTQHLYFLSLRIVFDFDRAVDCRNCKGPRKQ